MTVTRDIMTPIATFCSDTTTASQAARMMATDDIGSIPVCGADGKLCGVVTDRDLTIKVVAAGLDPDTVQVGELVAGMAVITVDADDTIENTIQTMKDFAVRRLPVVDGATLVGVVSQADIARAMPDTTIGDLVGVISSAPPNG